MKNKLNIDNKNISIQKLYKVILAKFGENTFEIIETKDDNSLLLNSIENNIWSYSIIAIDDGNYSIQIETEYPELKKRIISFDIPYVNDKASLEEVIDALEKCGQKNI